MKFEVTGTSLKLFWNGALAAYGYDSTPALAGPGLMVRDPAGAMSVVAVDGDLSAGPELGLDGGGQTTLAWQDARGVLGLTSGGRPQVVGSVADNATLSTLSVSSDGRGILSFVASAARPDGNGDGGPVVRVAGRPVGRGFLAPVTLSKPGPLISLVAAAAVPGGSDAVSWATSIGAPRAGLLFVSTRSPGRLAGAALAPAVAVSEPGLIA